MRVLQVLTCDDVGGTELMVSTLVERMDPDFVESEVATLDAPGPIAERLARAGVPVCSLGGAGRALAFAKLARMIRAERFDVVNAYGFKSTAVMRVLVRLLSRDTSFVSGVRGLHVTALERIDGLKSRCVLALERMMSRLVDVYDCNSRGALELLAANGVDRRRLRYIPNGIDVALWKVDRADRDPERSPMVICVARFVPLKRHVDLVHAAALLRDANVDFRLLLVGEGPTLESVQGLVDQLGLRGNVTFAGAVGQDEVRALMRDASIFCLPSLWEGMAGSVMEAMAAELPVVATRVNGIEELVEHERTGLLVSPERPDRLAEALGALLRDSERRRAFGPAGRARIAAQFNLERMVVAKQDLYRSAVARAGDMAAV